MTGADFVLAAMLLTIPPGVPCPAPSEADWPRVRDAVQHVAIEWEILDRRESRYVLNRVDEFCADLNMLRRRHRELADCPKVAEGAHLPDHATASDMVRFNRAFRKKIDLRQQLEVDRAEPLREALHEADRLYQVWDAVRDARHECFYVTNRRQSLKKLKDLVGDEAFYSADLPPNVPTWRFNELAH